MLLIICSCNFSNDNFFIRKVGVAFVVVVSSNEIIGMKLMQGIVCFYKEWEIS